MAKSSIIIKNFVLIFTSNVIGQLLYLGGLMYLARTLGAGGFGLWNFAQAWLIYLFRGGEMGLEVIGVKEIARNPDGTPQLITAIVVSRCILVVILVIIIFTTIVLRLIPADAVPLLIVFSLSIFPMAFILEWVFEGHQSLLNVGVARVAKGAIFFILVVLFVKSTYEMTLSALFYVVSLTLPILYIGWLALRLFGCANIKGIFSLFPNLWKSALPVGFATLLSNYSLFFGTMIIGYTMQRDQLGYFTASHRIMIFLWAYIISSLQRIVLPTLSNLHQNSTEKFRAFVEKFLLYAAFLSIGIGLLVTCFSKIIIYLLYSDSYYHSIQVLQILVWAFVMASIRAILEIALLASDNQKKYFLGMIFVAVLYTILTPSLVYLYGINGAAYAALITELSYLLVLAILWSREYSSNLWKTVAKYFIAASIASIVFFAIKLNTVLSLTCMISAYLGCLIILKVFSKSEFAEIPKLVRTVLKNSI
jgi:O-antigen/teichoic acid export membrane protein